MTVALWHHDTDDTFYYLVDELQSSNLEIIVDLN